MISFGNFPKSSPMMLFGTLLKIAKWKKIATKKSLK
jgi:hypothetical protein